MLELKLDVDPQTAQRLRKLLASYPDQEAFAQSIIAYQINELRRANLNLQLDLAQFEEKYRLDSAEFYKQFERGELGDGEDYILWAGLYETLRQNEQKLASLQNGLPLR
jgi:hypothetical protein